MGTVVRNPIDGVAPTGFAKVVREVSFRVRPYHIRSRRYNRWIEAMDSMVIDPLFERC